MQVREIRVEFKKTVSDGAYGNDSYTVGYTAAITEADDEVALTRELCVLASEMVVARLKESVSEGVRAALETREEREARWQQEQDEYLARRAPRAGQIPSDEPIARSGEMPLKDEDSPF